MSTNGNGADNRDRRDVPTLAPHTGDIVVVPDFGSFMRQVFPEYRTGEDAGRGGMATTRGTRSSYMRRDYEAALKLLQRASDAVPALLHHCQQLEADMRRIAAEAEADVQIAHGETQQWRQIAVAMKLHLEESDHQIALMRKRLAAAEERLAAGESIAQAAEHQASLAMGITTMFHDKIVDAFGAGSAVHAAIDGAVPGPRGGNGSSDG